MENAFTYIGTIKHGKKIGLPYDIAQIINIGGDIEKSKFGTQIAICNDGDNFGGIYYHNTNSSKKDWIEVLDTRERNGFDSVITAPDDDANNCLDTGKAYACALDGTKNIPSFKGSTDEGIIIPYMAVKGQFGSQIFMPLDSASIWLRIVKSGVWSKWHCIGGGSWTQEIQQDSEQVSKFLRWERYEKNHVIFDASKGSRPDGQACNRINSDAPWSDTYPSLMGFNGASTFGVRVDSSRTADLVKGRDLATELDSLKQSAVDGKQTIINGINTAVGSNSGLTINNSWGDLNWWIVNKTLSGSSIKVNIYVNGSEANNTLNNNPNRIFYKPVQYLGTDGQYGWRTVHVFRFPLANLFDMTTPILCIIGNYELYSHIINFKNSIGKTIERSTYSFFRGDNSYNVNGHKLVVTGSYMDISMTCNIVNSDYGTDEIGKCLSAVKLTFIGS